MLPWAKGTRSKAPPPQLANRHMAEMPWREPHGQEDQPLGPLVRLATGGSLSAKVALTPLLQLASDPLPCPKAQEGNLWVPRGLQQMQPHVASPFAQSPPVSGSGSPTPSDWERTLLSDLHAALPVTKCDNPHCSEEGTELCQKKVLHGHVVQRVRAGVLDGHMRAQLLRGMR